MKTKERNTFYICACVHVCVYVCARVACKCLFVCICKHV